MCLLTAKSKGASMKYQQLIQEQRYQISAYLKIGMTQTAIAKELNVHKSTVCRELKRNRGGRGYRPQQAHRLASERHRNKPKRRIDAAVFTRIKSLLNTEWSPEQISNRLKLEHLPAASHETIYQYVYQNKQTGGMLYTHLRHQRKYKKRSSKYDKRGIIPNRQSIDERPLIVETRSRLGDWETDTIIGSRHRQAIVSLVERKSRFCLLQKVAYKSAELVQTAICQKLKPLKRKVLTITSDNGKEFARHTAIAAALKADFFFAHPYAAWERGTNENLNGLVRQYFPKRTDFSKLTDEEVELVTDRLNNRPRKTLGFRTPNEIFFNKTVALIT